MNSGRCRNIRFLSVTHNYQGKGKILQVMYELKKYFYSILKKKCQIFKK